MTEKRTKEPGIHKINGLSVSEIEKMLNLVFIKWPGLYYRYATCLLYYPTMLTKLRLQNNIEEVEF